MMRLVFYSVFSAILVFQPVYAFSMTRDCKAKYILYIYSQNHKYLDKVDIIPFTARGSCGKTAPNKCRDRAKSNALTCMEFHYNNDFYTNYPITRIGYAPYYCSNHKGIYNYSVKPDRELAVLIEKTACHKINKSSGTYYVKIHAHVEGKTHCKKDVELKRPYNDQYPDRYVFTCSGHIQSQP